MLFNLQNLPFLGHIRSIIRFIARCLPIKTFLSKFTQDIGIVGRGIAENTIQRWDTPFDSGFPLTADILPNKTNVELTWAFYSEYFGIDPNTISHFIIEASSYGEFSEVSQSEELNAMPATSSRVNFDGDGVYVATTEFNGDPFSFAPFYSQTYRILIYGEDGCILVISNSSSVLIEPPPDPPVCPSPDPRCLNTTPSSIFSSRAVFPPGCVDIDQDIIKNIDPNLADKVPTEASVELKVMNQLGTWESRLRINLIVKFRLVVPPLDESIYFAKALFPNRITLEYSTTGCMGPFASVEVEHFLWGKYSEFYSPNDPTQKTFEIGVEAAGGTGNTVCYRLVTEFFPETPPNPPIAIYRYNIQCLGSLSIPSSEKCYNAPIVTVGNATVTNRSLIAGVYGDPCGIYQYLEVDYPLDLNPAIGVRSTFYGLRFGSTILNDYDGTLNPGVFGAIDIAPSQANGGYFPESLLASINVARNPLDDYAFIPGQAAQGRADYAGNQYSFAGVNRALAFAYRDVAGNYVLKTVPSAMPNLVRVGSFSDKEITINGEIGVVKANGFFLHVFANFIAPIGSVYENKSCNYRNRAGYNIAIQTAQEINAFYRANKASFVATCPKGKNPPPAAKGAWVKGQPMGAGATMATDAHLSIVRNGGAIWKNSIVLLDDNSSPNPLNYFYVEMTGGNAHLIKYTQLPVSSTLEPDWLDDNNKNPCVSANGFLIDNVYYYTGEASGPLTLVGDASTLPARFGIEDKFLFSFGPLSPLRMQGNKKPLSVTLEYIHYDEQFEAVLNPDGLVEFKPRVLDSGNYFKDVSGIGGAFYHVTKKMGNYPNISLPYFCYGEGVDGYNNFVGISRASFETGYFKEIPDTGKIFNFIEIVGAGTGFGLQGASLFDLTYAYCGQDLCFDPLISKRGMVKISTEVNSLIGKRFRGIMNGSVHETTNPLNHIHVTDFDFLRTGKSLYPEIDITTAFIKKTGVLRAGENDMSMICSGCKNARLSGHAEMMFGSPVESPIFDAGNFIFAPHSTGTLRFSGTYQIYSPQLDCMEAADSPELVDTVTHVEYVNYSIPGTYKDFFCLTGEQCGLDHINKSVTDYIHFTGLSVPHESVTITARVSNTGKQAINSNVRRFAKKDGVYIDLFEQGTATVSATNDSFDVYSYNDYVLAPYVNGSRPTILSGGKTGYASKNTDVALALEGRGYFPAYSAVYRGKSGEGDLYVGSEYRHSFVAKSKNAYYGDSLGRSIKVISNGFGDIKDTWGSELRDLYNSHYYANQPDYVSVLDDVAYEEFSPIPLCGELLLPIVEDVDYKPVKIRVVNDSDLPIHTNIRAYISSSGRGVVDAIGGTVTADFGNSGEYPFQLYTNVGHNFLGYSPPEESSSPPYSYKSIQIKAIVSGRSSGYNFFLDPNAHFFTIAIERLFPTCHIHGNHGPVMTDTDSASEIYIISRTGVSSDVLNTVSSGDPYARVLQVHGFHPRELRKDIEVFYGEHKVLVETKTLNLSADTDSPYTGEVDTLIASFNGYGEGSSAMEAEAQAQLRIDNSSWVPNGSLGNFNNVKKALASSQTIEHQQGFFSSTQIWHLSGYINEYRDFNLNPSMYLTGVNFGEHVGYHFILEVNGGYLNFSGYENSETMLPSPIQHGFKMDFNASGSGLSGAYGSYGNFSNILGAYIPYDEPYQYTPRENTVKFKQTGQILMTSNGSYVPLNQYDQSPIPLFWDKKFGSNVSVQKLTDILTGDFNDFYSEGNSQFPNSMCDYKGLHRSFNEMDIYLKNKESKFSGIFLDLSGRISIPTTGRPPVLESHSSYEIIYTTGSSYAIDVQSGIYLGSLRNYRGKDFYLATVAHSTSNTPFNPADAFGTMKSGVEKVLSGYKISGVENHYGFLSYATNYDFGLAGDVNIYYADFLYKKNKKVIPSGNATFNLYRVDHSLQIKTLNANGLPNVPINSTILGAPMPPSCPAVFD